MNKGLKIFFTGAVSLTAGAGGAYLYSTTHHLTGQEKQAEGPRPAPPPAPSAAPAPAPAETASPPPLRVERYGQYSGLEDKTKDGFIVHSGFIALMHKEGFADGHAPVLDQKDFDDIVGESRKKIISRYRVRALDEKGEVRKAAKELKDDPDRKEDFHLTLSVPYYVRKDILAEIETQLKNRGIALAENPPKPPVNVMFEKNEVKVTLSPDDVRKLTGMKKPAASARPGPRP